jgi:Mn2+/Fe2+ NRAMP family transporter
MNAKTHGITAPPRGWRRMLYLGPGLVWAASSVGVAELVFATRTGALFGYALLWAPLLSLFMKFFVTELVGRYTIATGENVVQAFARVEVKFGPVRLRRGWILWLFWIFFLASVAGMSGIALAVGSCLGAFFPGASFVFWAVMALLAVGAILLIGSYRALEWASRVLVAAMVFFMVYAVFESSPPAGELAGSLVPRVPEGSLPELIPLLGWTGAGAIGTVWFSLWTQGSGRGMAGRGRAPEAAEVPALRQWIGVNRLDLAFNTVLTGILTAGFLIAGATVLRPQGLVPRGEGIGTMLARIAGVSFGRWGEIIFLTGVFGTLFSTLLADIDGLCRVASNALRSSEGDIAARKKWYRHFLFIYIASATVFAAVVPAPVALLQVTAGIDTILLPVIIALTMYICAHYLPEEFRPGRAMRAMLWVSMFFFVFFIVLLIVSMARGVHLGL